MDRLRAAKDQFNAHCERHKCRIGKCDDRRVLWLGYMRAAEVWGGYKVHDNTRGLL